MTKLTLSERQDLVLKTLRKVQPAGGPQIAKILDFKPSSVGTLLRRLEKLEVVYHVVQLSGKTNQPTFIYRTGINPDPRVGDQEPIYRPVVKSWAPNHQRDELVTALFGEARP